MATKNKKYDVMVIGAGPTGMMAAIAAATNGARVALLDKNEYLGRKLLMTGGGRCNFTQDNQNIKELISHYGENGRFLFSPFSVFAPEDVIEFFRSRGVESKSESGRVFPASGKAEDILNTLRVEMDKLEVDFYQQAIVKKVQCKEEKIESVTLVDGKIYTAKKYIICVGGMSYPSSGSTGDGYGWLKNIGHKIISPRPALTPLRLSDSWVKELSGITLKDVNVVAKKGGKVISSSRGEILFAHFGLTGPAAINLSAEADITSVGCSLSLDLIPDKKESELFTELSAEFATSKVLLKKFLRSYFPQRFIEIFLSKLKIKDLMVNSISHKEIRRLCAEIKNCLLSFSGIYGFDRAMVTAGGVDVSEVDPKTMKSKIITNLYLAGEILDITGQTGGYNLQLCWSTGFVAGRSAAEDLKK